MAVVTAVVQVSNKLGLHIHPAEMISRTALHYRSLITIAKGEEVADARSAVALVALGADLGTTLVIHAEGVDAEPAVAAIVKLCAAKFGEED